MLGRPYDLTYELLDKKDGEAYSRLRVVSPSELNAEANTDDVTPSESRGEPVTPNPNGVPEAFDLVGEDGTVIIKNNRLTIDDASRQALSQQEIEELKKSMGGKEIVEKILANHSGLDEKTSFSKAKYTLRKTKKYLRRFTVLPMDTGNLIDYIMVKEAPRIMELRDETLGLIIAWSNAHFSSDDGIAADTSDSSVGGGRLLVLDETGGLVVAAIADKMGTLYPDPGDSRNTNSVDVEEANRLPGETAETDEQLKGNAADTADQSLHADPDTAVPKSTSNSSTHLDFPLPTSTNSITVLHPAVQPNLSLLKYFGYDTNQPDLSHPLHKHLKPLSWLQLLRPEEDVTYREPELASDHTLRSWKSGKRSTYWKKRRRWERCRSIVDETKGGGFDGLVICSRMDPTTILPHTVPLVRGGGHVVIYSSTLEPLVNVMDLYSRERRSAYINRLSKGEVPDGTDFPVDPRLLLAPTLQTSRAREWQVLPGRTHPLMTGRGGAEGYVFTARRVLPLEGGVQAKGNFAGKRRKLDQAQNVTAT